MPQNVITFEDFVAWIKMTKTESWADYMWDYDLEQKVKSEKQSVEIAKEESGGWRTVQRGRGRGNARSNGRGRGRQQRNYR